MAKRKQREGSKNATSEPASKHSTLVSRLKPNQTADAAIADMVVAGLTTNAATVVELSTHHFGQVDLTECLRALVQAAERVKRGDLGETEALLIAQAVTLNALFTQLANRAQRNMGQYLDAADRYLRLALKAQSQCRATVETLAAMKNPPTVFAKQANIAHGSQQVNNSVTLARAGISESEPNKLLEAHGERMELGAAGATGARDQTLETVGTVYRSTNR